MFPWFGGILKRPEGELQIDFQSCLDQSDQQWSICRGWLLPSQEALRTRWKSQIILLFLTVKKCSFIVIHSYSQDLTGDSHASSHPTEILFKLAQAVRSAHPGTSMHTSTWSDSACLSVFQARWRHQSPKLQMLKMQRSPKSLKIRKHQLASGASWIFLVLVVGLVSRPICGARWHSMFVTVSKWTWLYPNATFSFVQDLRLALITVSAKKRDGEIPTKKACLTCTRIMEIGKASKSRWPRDMAAFKSFKTYIIIYYLI